MPDIANLRKVLSQTLDAQKIIQLISDYVLSQAGPVSMAFYSKSPVLEDWTLLSIAHPPGLPDAEKVVFECDEFGLQACEPLAAYGKAVIGTPDEINEVLGSNITWLDGNRFVLAPGKVQDEISFIIAVFVPEKIKVTDKSGTILQEIANEGAVSLNRMFRVWNRMKGDLDMGSDDAIGSA